MSNFPNSPLLSSTHWHVGPLLPPHLCSVSMAVRSLGKLTNLGVLAITGGPEYVGAGAVHGAARAGETRPRAMGHGMRSGPQHT
jgi:hypothetical protein